ncbi:MAG: fumarylacetoacetate hydrolase family protein [bacterium]
MKFGQVKTSQGLRIVVEVERMWMDLRVMGERLGANIPFSSVETILFKWREAQDRIRELVAKATLKGDLAPVEGEIIWLPPLRRARTFRDFYAFEEHVRNVRRLRGLEVDPNWYRFPVFYYSHPGNFVGSGAPVPFPSSSQKWDYELEVAAVLGEGGKDVDEERAEKMIAGFTILNDWSARDIQRVEMTAGLGPAKSKEFATSLGPWLVTPDEIEDARSGKGYNLSMVARVNGEVTSQGNWSAVQFSFGEMIAYASQGCPLYPGEVFGSGTVGRGCLLERGWDHNLWLKTGDRVELEIERLGVLANQVF